MNLFAILSLWAGMPLNYHGQMHFIRIATQSTAVHRRQFTILWSLIVSRSCVSLRPQVGIRHSCFRNPADFLSNKEAETGQK